MKHVLTVAVEHCNGAITFHVAEKYHGLANRVHLGPRRGGPTVVSKCFFWE